MMRKLVLVGAMLFGLSVALVSKPAFAGGDCSCSYCYFYGGGQWCHIAGGIGIRCSQYMGDHCAS